MTLKALPLRLRDLNLYTVNETGPAWLGVLKNLNKIVKRKYDIELPPLGIFSKIKGKPATGMLIQIPRRSLG